MIKVVIINYHPKYHIGDTVEVTKNEAFGLINNGVAMLTKEITQRDTQKRNVKRGKK